MTDGREQDKEIFRHHGRTGPLDTLLNSVLVEVLHLGSSPLIEPVVATLDLIRKIEILKERVPCIRNEDWKGPVTRFLSKAGSVFRQRTLLGTCPQSLKTASGD